MDNIIPNHPNSPDDCTTDNPTASEIADSIMNDVRSEYDINDFMSIEEQAVAFRELVGTFASNKFDFGLTIAQNLIDRATLVKETINGTLESCIKRKGFN